MPLQTNLPSRIYLALTLIGSGDAIYLAREYTTQQFSCNVSSFFSCGAVASSGHTSLLGIPFWVTGLVWFPVTLIAGLLAFRYYAELILALFLMIGNVFTIYLWYLELAVIHKICPACLSLYIINYAMTALVAWMAVTGWTPIMKPGSRLAI
jgi:uncharacterized membrane protein